MQCRETRKFTYKIVDSLSDEGYAIIVTIIFLFLGTILAYHHEMWRDEIQAWLISRDSSSLIALFKHLKYEGHPGLWHLCLYPLKFITQSPIIMQIFHLLIAAITVYLFVRFSPFTRLQKVLFAFGYFSFYEYSVVCRNYVLGVLLLFLFCILFDKRFEKFPLIGAILFLLAHTSVHAAICTISIFLALFLDYLLRKSSGNFSGKKVAIGIGFFVTAMGLVTSVIQMKPPPDSGFAMSWKTDFALNHLRNVLKIIPNAFFPMPQFTLHFWGSNLLDKLSASSEMKLVLSGLILLFAILLLQRTLTALLMYFSGTIGLLAFFYTKYFGSIRHHGFLFMIFLASVWVCRSDAKNSSGLLNYKAKLLSNIFNSLRCEKYQNVVLTIILVAHLFGGISAAVMDYKYTFSQGKAVARYIRKAKLDNMPIVGDIDFATSTIAGYLENKIYYPRGDRLGSFVIWDKKRTKDISVDDVLKKAKELNTKSNQDVLIILNYSLNQNIISQYSLTEEKRFEEAVVGDEVYYLYIMNSEDF